MYIFTFLGLYSSILGPLVYAIFGSSKDSPVGPTAIEGLLVRENKHELGVPGAVLLCFLSGCVEFSMGILHLGISNASCYLILKESDYLS